MWMEVLGGSTGADGFQGANGGGSYPCLHAEELGGLKSRKSCRNAFAGDLDARRSIVLKLYV
jgi:hypothetical protein